MNVQPKRIRKRASRAIQNLQLWQPRLQDVYDYLMPYRRGAQNRSPGPPSMNKIFDSTPLRGGPRFAGRVQQFLIPPGQPFYKLHAGPMFNQQGAEKKRLNEELEQMTEVGHAALNNSNCPVAIGEMFLDYFAGTGAMLIMEGPDHQPIRCVAVPKWEVALEAGPFGDIIGRHWSRCFKAGDLPDLWPKGNFSDELSQKIKNEEDADVTICQSTVWDDEKQRWRLFVFEHDAAAGAGNKDDAGFIFEEDYRTSPWITPRCFACPGEAEGFGPGMLALPGTKTLNKVREYDLMAAGIALFGVWAYQDDGAFNPSAAKFAPGAFWKVQSNATNGAFGPSVSKLNIPGDYDLSRMITQDERAQIESAMMDRQLPPVTGSVRSPTELMERLKDSGEELVALLARQHLEIVQPIVMRTNEILARKKVLPANLTIDQITIGLQVVSPIVQAAQAQIAKGMVDAASILAGLGGPDVVSMGIRVQEAAPDLSRMLGVKEKYIPTPEEIQNMIAARQQQAQAVAAAEAAKNAPEPPAPDQQIMNGAVQ